MERRVHYDSWLKGFLKRRASNSLQDQSITSMNVYNRIERPGDGLWFSWGADTRMGDRIFGQRLLGSSQTTASAPLFFGDGSVYSFVACKKHVYSISGIVNGTQQLTLAKDFSAINPGVQIVDAAAFKGRIYFATAQVTNGVPDPALPQAMWVWDQASPTANWTNPPSALNAPTWPAGTTTTVSTSFANAGVATFIVGSTTGMPGAGNFDVVIDSEIIQVSKNSGTVLNVITRGRLGSPTTAHQANASVTYNPGISVGGTAGQTRWQYYVTTSLAGQDSPPSQTQTVLFGAANLDGTNYNILTFNTVTGQNYTVVRSYAGGNPNTVGIIAQNIVGTGTPATFNDTGLAVTGLQYQITPQFAIGDSGKAIAFAVIRNTLWRAAGPRMWAWDGQQSAWTGESIIGDPNTNITSLDIYNDSLVIFKQDGIYTLNRSGDVFTVFPGFKTLGFNPRPIGQWQGNYYFASDVGMVWLWDGSNVKSIGFDYAEAYPFPDGTFGLPNVVTLGVGLPNYFLVGFQKWNSNNNASFYFAWDGVGWHPFHYDPNYVVTGLGATGGNQVPVNPTIQFGKATWNNTTFTINYLTQPTLDPYLITSYDTTPQTIFLPVDSGIISDEWKVLEGLRVFIENPTTGTVRISYSSDDNIFTQTYIDLGAPQNDKTPLQTFIPSGALPVYRKIMFKVVLTPAANSATPIIRMVMHRYKQRETQRKSWTMALFLEEGQMTPTHNREQRTAKQMLKHLNDARKERNLVEFVDLVGDKYMVYVESVGESLKTYRTNNKTTSFTCKVVLVEPAEIGNE
jgi:hypothetical protein